MNLCYICGSETKPYELVFHGPGVRINCPTCGSFRLSERVVQDLQERITPSTLLSEASIEALPRASGAIRELVDTGADVFVENVDNLLASVSVPQDPLDAIDKIILHVFRRTTSAAEYVRFDIGRDYSVAYARDKGEFRYLLERAVDLDLLETNEDDLNEVRLTLAGWQRVRELRKTRADARQAFVAMSFAPTLRPVFSDGILPALEACGYRAMRIDMSQHNEKIDDRIIAEIRKSALLVSDVTGHRAGVYFEAGFALGLGIPVIWTCRDADIRDAHFDTRQYNHIVWRSPEDLRSKLRARIEATLPIWSPLRGLNDA